jgi:hypothetical protein
MEDIEDIIKQIIEILSPAGYYIQTTEDKPIKNAYTFQIFTKDKRLVSSLVIHITEDMIKTSSTRNAKEKDMTIFDIKIVHTTPDFRGKGFASILISYGLCMLKKSFPNIDYAVLDDHTGHAQNMKELYSRFGFSTQYPTELVSNKTIKINNSGKQVKLDEYFISKVNDILSNVSTPSGMGRKNKKKQKTKKTKKQKQKNKNQKTKNQKTKKQKPKNKKTKNTKKQKL